MTVMDKSINKVMTPKTSFKDTAESLKSQIAQHIQEDELLRQSEKKYRILVENLSQRIFHKDKDSVYISCNKNYADFLNIAPEKIVGKTDYDFYSKELAEKYRADDKRIIESGTVETIEEICTRNGKEEIVQTVKAPIKDEAGAVVGVLGIFWDITERKKLENTVRESEERARALLNAPFDTAVLVNDKGIIIDCNRAFMKRFNKDKDVLVGSSAFDLLEPEVAKRRRNAIKKVVLEGKPLHLEDQHRGRWFYHSICPVLDNQRKVIQLAVVTHDYTEMKQAELELAENRDNLRLLTSQLTKAEEEARRIFANFLHDKIGQTLFILKIRLEMHQKSLAGSYNLDDLQEALKLLEKLLKDTRTVSYEMSPAVLQELGLEAALGWLTEKTNKDYDIVVNFKSDKQPIQLDDIVSTTLFRAVSELLTNIIKHAKAQNATITLGRENNSITICVDDDGIGFDISNLNSFPSEEKGYGIFNIKERLNYLGGELTIASSGGQGTKITLRAPLKI